MTGRRSAAVAWVLVGALPWVPRPAAAEDGVAVAFSFEGCAEGIRPEVERLARIELHAVPSRGEATTQVELACAEEDVRMAVDDPLTGKRVERTVSLAIVAERDRARLLALAIAELVRSSWIELELQPTPALPIAAPVHVSAEEQERARMVATADHRRRWYGYAAIDALVVPSVGSPILGLSLGVQRDVARWAFVEGAVSAWDGAAERSTGSVAVRQIALDSVLGWRFGILELAAGARLGWVSLAGTPSGSAFRGDTASGLIVGPAIALSLPIVGPLWLWLRSGWLVHGERGIVAGDSDVIVGGVYGSLGLGLRLGH